tara:strand:- start:26 stop:3889 length:3864 start_codon:yes stop_codon:yes gene_type:complete
MAFEKHIVDRLSTRLPSLLPDWIQEEAPVFELFLKSYFEYLESEIIVLEDNSLTELEGIQLEVGTSEIASALLLETGTNLDTATGTEKLLTQQELNGKPLEPLKAGEYIFGETNGSLAKIKVISGNTLIVDSISGTGFAEGEKVVGRDGQQSGKVKTYKENSVVANNRLLDYSDIDQTLESFLKYFQKDFIPSLDLRETQNPRLTLKNISSLYKQKGTPESVKFLMRLLFGEEAEIKYPIEETVVLSESKFNEERRMTIKMADAGKIPSATDKILQFDTSTPTLVTADAIIENVFVVDQTNDLYSISISLTHRGEFEFNREVSLVNRDGDITRTATVLGVVSTIDNSNGSVYLSLEDNSGDILDEDGNGLLLERTSFGSMYDTQDVINFTGGKTDTDAVSAKSNVTGLSKGGVERIYIENGGQNYEAGDIVVFDNTGTNGNGAEAIIGVTGSELLLENASALDQYEFLATSGQTVFGGLGVVDVNNKPVALPPSGDFKVFIDGVLKADTNYTFTLDKVTFTTNPNLTGGEVVEIVSESNNIIFESATPKIGNDVLFLDDSTQEIRSVQITNPGAGYEKMPTVFPGGYLYFDDLSGFQTGSTVTGAGGATGTILRIEEDKRRLVIKRASSNTGTFVTGELITSGSISRNNIQAKVSSGTGAKLFSWSSQIGAVEKLTITSQGYNFDGDAVISDDSFHNMLITGPSSTPTKGVTITGNGSGATAIVQTFDNQRQILKYTNLNGQFIDNEKVLFNETDSFKILKNDNYTARGKVAGEGNLNDSFLSDQGFLSEENAHIQDSKFYQSHSYVVKAGESINKYRSILKELVHPSGHIFFGEVAIKSNILSSSKEESRYDESGSSNPFDVNTDNQLGIASSKLTPTIVIQAFPTDNMLYEESSRDNPVRILLENNSLLENEESRDNVAHASREKVFLILTTKDEVDGGLGLITQLKHAITNTTIGGETIKDAHHVNILSVRKFLDSDSQSIISSRVSGNNFPTTGTFNAVIQKSPRRDNALSVSNMVDKENDYYVPDLGISFDSSNQQAGRGSIEVRPSDSGLVFQLFEAEEEVFIFEGATVDKDGEHCGGSKILNEEPLNFLRHEPFDRDLHGHKILLEDDSGSIMVEDDTVPEERHYFVTERSIEQSNPFLYYENEDRIITEDGLAFIKEDAGESVHSFVPLGSTFKTLNKIAFQNCYKISRHMYLESGNAANNVNGINTEYDRQDEDKILLEDGISAVLSEETEDEGLTISQLDSILGNTYINDLDELARRRTNVAFSSYVNSSNVTNSEL